MFLRNIGRALLGLAYAITPLGWYALYNSFKRVEAGQIAAIKNLSGSVEIIGEGLYFRPFPGDSFTESYSKALDFIDLGAKLIVRIKEGFLGVKTNEKGEYEELKTGIHIIDRAKGETFDNITMKVVISDDFTLGNVRYVTIRDGELGESYKNGVFEILKPGQYKLPLAGKDKSGKEIRHLFVKKAPINTDVVDLGAVKIVTVKEGQVAVITTAEGVRTLEPGKHHVKQSEGAFFNAILTTSAQSHMLPALKVMCSDQIEMTAKSLITYKVDKPLKTVGLGIKEILKSLEHIAEATLRTILSQFSSTDIAPSTHTDKDHDSSKRKEKLKEVHDQSVNALNDKAQEWGLSVTDLQITEILPADDKYLATIRALGEQQSKAEAERRIAENAAKIAEINANAESSRITAARKEQEEADVRATTAAKTKKIEADTEAERIKTLAAAEAEAILAKARAEASRINMMNEATKDATGVTAEVMKLELQLKMMEKASNPPVLVAPFGQTTVFSDGKSRNTLFSTGSALPKGDTVPVSDGSTLATAVTMKVLGLGGQKT